MKTTLLMTIAGVTLAASGLTHAGGQSTEAKAAYSQAKDRAKADYKVARARCDLITGNPKDICVAEAKAAQVRTVEEASALYKNTLKAYTASRMKIASANYDLDKVKCAGLTGNPKDVCVTQAKATLVAAQADAKADRQAIEARATAREDKREAEYKVAMEKCDAFAGAAKDGCVSAAKAQFAR